MTTAALIPLKCPWHSKSRLSPFLTACERHWLTIVMAERVLGAIVQSEMIDKSYVLTNSVEVEQLSSRFGATVIRESSLTTLGVVHESYNSVLKLALSNIYQSGAANVLIIHADLPLIETEDVSQICSAFEIVKQPVVVPDRHKLGTNALMLPANATFQFSFGNNSLSNHRRDALIHTNSNISFDIDVPSDLIDLAVLDVLSGPDSIAINTLASKIETYHSYLRSSPEKDKLETCR